VIAMIARALIKQDPFAVWGNGEQVRNWTYVGDIVSGTIRAAEVVEDGTPVNLRTMERTRVFDAVNEVWIDTPGRGIDHLFTPDSQQARNTSPSRIKFVEQAPWCRST
jgi:nucleoside-diphosphate-sugar epimerase